MKKIFYALCCAASLSLFSCVSTPVPEEKSDEKNTEPMHEELDEGEILNELEEPLVLDIMPQDENLFGAEKDIQEKTFDAPLVEEKVEADELPELAEEKLPDNPADSLMNEEPLVKDDDPKESGEIEEAMSIAEDSSVSPSAPEVPHDFEHEGEVESEEAELPSKPSFEPSYFEPPVQKVSEKEAKPKEEKTAEEKTSQPSRSMTVPKNQLIDVNYPGKGWTYQGAVDSDGNVDVRNRNFVFGGRKLGGENTNFTLRSRNPGKFLLHFSKNDVLSGTYIDDYLEVIVKDEASKNTSHIIAPDYASVVPKRKKTQTASQKSSEKAKVLFPSDSNLDSEEDLISNETEDEFVPPASRESDFGTVIKEANENKNSYSSSIFPYSGTSSSGVSSDSKKLSSENSEGLPSEILSDAQKAYDERNYPKALLLVDKYLKTAASDMDEGIFLKARTLEARSAVQNIKEAVRLYELLLKTYPLSRLWDKANERSIYLKRMYINIR